MFWERVTEDIYLFTSDRYALVNSVAILTTEGTVVIDALPFPDEAMQIAQFLAGRSGGRFRSLILTHYHMDHAYGLFAFPPGVDLIAHTLCMQKLNEVGEISLAEARNNDPLFNEVTLRSPQITFDTGELTLISGNKTFRLMHLPGHTADNIGAFYEEERILFAGDAVMAIPIIADGDYQQAITTLNKIKSLEPETVVQGHGEVILRGEVQEVMNTYIRYLECVAGKANEAFQQGKPRKSLWDVPLEACGLERVPLGIASHQLHAANMLSIYDQLQREQCPGS